MQHSDKISLHGFNNLTKSLSFSLYRVHYIHDELANFEYKKLINELYSSDKLSGLLSNVCHAIGGNILNIASQNYQPHGASVTLMISEEAQPESLVAHLDKSHLCIHTYPDDNPQNGIAIFRADIELSTCGVISPLKVIDHIIEEFNADVIDIDYRVRGMTRNTNGDKVFTDEPVTSLADFTSSDIKENYDIECNALAHCNLFHARLARKKIVIDDSIILYRNKNTPIDSTIDYSLSIHKNVERTIRELFNS
jgi:S-adenosylmethionine decarboxylase